MLRQAVAGWRRLRLAARARLAPAEVRRLVVMLQNGCALRCRMCDLWLEEPRRLPREGVLELLRSPALAPTASVSWTGGEPFLYPGFASLYAEARALRPAANMDISTSGVPADAVLRFLETADARKLTLVFSYDGAGTHDRQRGKPGAEQELLELVAKIKGPRVALRMTLTPENAGAVLPTFEKTRALGVELWLQEAHFLPEYTNSVRQQRFALPVGLERDLESVFARLSLSRERAELGHLDALLRRLRGEAAGAVCPVPTQSAFVRADGALLTCRGAKPVGNVLQGGLEAAWRSAEACALRRSGCGRCEPRYSEF